MINSVKFNFLNDYWRISCPWITWMYLQHFSDQKAYYKIQTSQMVVITATLVLEVYSYLLIVRSEVDFCEAVFLSYRQFECVYIWCQIVVALGNTTKSLEIATNSIRITWLPYHMKWRSPLSKGNIMRLFKILLILLVIFCQKLPNFSKIGAWSSISTLL